MAFFKEELLNVKAFIFDVDGVLSSDTSPIDLNGEPMRTANVKDGFAIRNALLNGYPMAIISGGKNENVAKRYKKLGIEHIYIAVGNKTECFNDFMDKTGIAPKEIMYMGDDLPDYAVMQLIGVPTCPADAVTEIKTISKYISDRKGGEGCVRDVIEQVMRAQGNWLNTNIISNPSF
ncbi:MAG: HAD hydrolase-like protein [Prolixibacteraceae bacterium]|jgi:3-deoxy-D-manno-octulosonate 8-phosphate phosphatase (KDO 8-P phosphatase)|nr:HAD hydrolase-like protein [Prolixibacteraceae bacterium]